jgi:hypothetical protein
VSEMVKRMAQAMAESAGFCWENCAQSQWERDARAALESMREPTDAIKAMSMCNDFAERLWPAMIDAALSAAKGET